MYWLLSATFAFIVSLYRSHSTLRHLDKYSLKQITSFILLLSEHISIVIPYFSDLLSCWQLTIWGKRNNIGCCWIRFKHSLVPRNIQWNNTFYWKSFTFHVEVYGENNYYFFKVIHISVDVSSKEAFIADIYHHPV